MNDPEYEYIALKSVGWKSALEITERFNAEHNADLHPTVAGQVAARSQARTVKIKGAPTLYDPLHIPSILDQMLCVFNRRQKFKIQA